MLYIIAIFLLSYLLGSISFGLVVTKCLAPGVNLRSQGSGNIGATNVLRNAGKLSAILTLIGDAGKGAAAVYVGSQFVSPVAGFYAGIMAVLGHVYPVWHGFRGGKAVATSLGVILVAQPEIGVSLLVIWLISYYLWKISAIAAINAFVAYGLWHIFSSSLPAIWRVGAFCISLLVIIRHKQNIKQLIGKSL